MASYTHVPKVNLSTEPITHRASRWRAPHTNLLKVNILPEAKHLLVLMLQKLKENFAREGMCTRHCQEVDKLERNLALASDMSDEAKEAQLEQ